MDIKGTTILIPDKINNFNAYLGDASTANRLIGVTDEVTLPNFEFTSETLSLAGMPGEIDSPTPGQLKSVTMEIPFSNIAKTTLVLAADDSLAIILRSAQDFIDPENYKKIQMNRTITVRGLTKAIDYGKLKKGGYGDAKITKEVIYYKDVINDEVVTEIDKFNGRVIIGGADLTGDINQYI